ncbi:prefoldin subunit, partial [Lasius niger]
DLRPKDRIVSVLQRRLEYVAKNVDSLQKQLETAETKYAAATVVSQPDATDEDGQPPITEIVEELDDDDNVVSYRLKRHGDSVPLVKEALEKAGISDLAEGEPECEQQTMDSSSVQTEDKPSQTPPNPISLPEKAPPPPTTTTRKAVSSPEDAEPAGAPAPDMSRRAKRVERIMRTAKEQESVSWDKPVIPEDEDTADMALRREMLKYNMGEVGAVVAEPQLEEGSSDD